jgi:hypothetical protein
MPEDVIYPRFSNVLRRISIHIHLRPGYKRRNGRYLVAVKVVRAAVVSKQ